MRARPADDRPDEGGGARRGYGYRIADDNPDLEPVEDDDLEPGVGQTSTSGSVTTET